MVWDHAAALQGLMGGPLAAALLVCCAAAVSAPAAAAAEPLALKRVTLSSGGVGYFEHEAEVEGAAAALELPVRLDQVADVLKSVVILDPAGGRGTVSLPGREPLAQAFRDLPFGAGALESLARLLEALRGAEVRVTGARAIEGRLLGVVPEAVRLPGGDEVTTRHRVGVMTASGAQQFVLEEAAAVEFADPELRAQVEAGLTALATHRARDRRTLRIDVAGGTGRRAVRVAYVVGVPLWKGSYRLTLPAEDGGGAGEPATARLQGWAVVENMSGRDWEGVELTVLSGNPVTFRQDLYSAYYVDRPEVPVEVLGRVLPPPDAGAVAGGAGPGGAGPRAKAAQAEIAGLAASRSLRAPAPPPMAAPESYGAMADEAAAAPGAAFAAEAEEAATQVAFRFPEPVGVPTGHSLMLPIIDRDVPAERLALYQPGTHATHPLATVRLTNDGETGLPPGVLTLYERGGGAAAATTYVGDARLGALPAGEERLVSFALDQKTRIDREERGAQRVAKGRISRGVLELTVLDEQTTVYRLKAPAREDRLVVIEHPRRPDWELVAPEGRDVELTAGDYRIRHALKAGAEDRVSVVARRPRVQRLELLELSMEDLALYARTGGGLEEPLRRAFARMAELRAEIDRRGRRLDELEARRDGIVEEQGRIRANLSEVPAEGDLHRRYLTRLNAQEDELERLAAETEAARGELERAREALSAYVAGLEL